MGRRLSALGAMLVLLLAAGAHGPGFLATGAAAPQPAGEPVVQGPAGRMAAQTTRAELLKLARQLEADRKLLIELRKGVPLEREEAELFFQRLKALAIESDPARLVPLANKVIDTAPAFFQWLEQEFESPEERVEKYFLEGARNFRIAFDRFEGAALLTIINRLEQMLNLIAALEAASER